MSAGIFITQQGVSVPTAADYQFVFNSNWPSLQVAFDTTVTIAANATLTIPHNLSFTPFTVGWILQNGISIGRIFAYAQRFISAPQSTVSFTFDSTNVYLTGDTTNSYEVNIKCYNLDITTSVDYTFPQYPKYPTLYDNTTGIKVTKSGKQINSTDLRDFILHSRAQSPAVLSVVTEALGVPWNSSFFGGIQQGFNVISYTNPAGYTPWVYGFYSQPAGIGLNNSSEIITYSQADYGVQAVGMLLTNPTSNGGFTIELPYDVANNQGATIVVLRDPLIATQTLEVQY